MTDPFLVALTKAVLVAHDVPSNESLSMLAGAVASVGIAYTSDAPQLLLDYARSVRELVPAGTLASRPARFAADMTKSEKCAVLAMLEVVDAGKGDAGLLAPMCSELVQCFLMLYLSRDERLAPACMVVMDTMAAAALATFQRASAAN